MQFAIVCHYCIGREHVVHYFVSLDEPLKLSILFQMGTLYRNMSETQNFVSNEVKTLQNEVIECKERLSDFLHKVQDLKQKEVRE